METRLKQALENPYDVRQTMSRNSWKWRGEKKSAAPGRPVVHCRALVLVDGSAIRKKIKKDYDKALRDLANSQRQLDQFQQTDLPQFTRWLNTHFGALLTELRELSQKLAADEALVFQVQSEYLFGGGSHARAYKRVMEARENPPPPPPPPRGGSESNGESEPSNGPPNFEDFGEEADPMEAFFNELFGELGPEEDAREEPHLGGDPGAPAAARPNGSLRLKELYRALVRRLHPDTQQAMTPQKAEWWHQTQMAYEAGDVQQLEVILTLCEIGESGTTANTSASLLQRITAQMKLSLREIKRQISARRNDPAWGFSRRADHQVMVLQMRHALARDLEALQNRHREIQALIAGWKTAAEKVRKPRRQKSRAQGM